MEAHPPIAQKKRCDAAFGRTESEIEELKVQVQQGALSLAFIDGAGFAQTRPNTGAWTPAGECHAATAVRGQRLNTIGALLSTGALLTAKRWERTTAERFAGFLGLLVEPVGKPLTAIVDKASGHTAKATLAKAQVRVAGLQDPRLQNFPGRPRRHLCKIRRVLPVDFLKGTYLCKFFFRTLIQDELVFK